MNFRILKMIDASGFLAVHQIRFWPGFHPGPRWGSLQRSPDPLAGLRESYLQGQEKGKKGIGEMRKKEWDKKGGEGKGLAER